MILQESCRILRLEKGLVVLAVSGTLGMFDDENDGDDDVGKQDQKTRMICGQGTSRADAIFLDKY